MRSQDQMTEASASMSEQLQFKFCDDDDRVISFSLLQEGRFDLMRPPHG